MGMERVVQPIYGLRPRRTTHGTHPRDSHEASTKAEATAVNPNIISISVLWGCTYTELQFC